MKHDFKVYLRLLSYLKPFWGIALLVLVGFSINAATEVSVAKLLEYIIEAIQNKDQSFTSLFPFLVVILMFFRGLGLFMGVFYCGDFPESGVQYPSGSFCKIAAFTVPVLSG